MPTDININKLSNMAKLNLPQAENEKIGKYMEIIVKDLERLTEVTTDSVKPLVHATELENVLREDKVVKKIDRETLLANAPGQANGCFKVPKTVE